MQLNLESALDRWIEAGLISPETGAQIRAWEAEHSPVQRSRWQVLAALAAGVIMLTAGVLLFVAAHWDNLSPSARFGLVLLMVGIFHVAGAVLAERFPALSTALHGVGTIALGAGIFLAGQIFNLAEHWPGGVMLWALGAVIGYATLRDWLQAALAAILVPAWLVSEWANATEWYISDDRAIAVGVLLLAFAYLTIPRKDKSDHTSRALTLIGAIVLIPAAGWLAEEAHRTHAAYWRHTEGTPKSLSVLAWALALVLPLALALFARRKGAWVNVVALLLALLLAFSRANGQSLAFYAWNEFSGYVICALGSCGLMAWGIMERRTSGINLGLIGFGITVITFYFSTVMDKLGRSVALMGLGVVFLVVAWGFEKTRRKLMARMMQPAGGTQ